MKRSIKRNIIRVLQIVLIFGAASLVMLYALGYYDLTFIDRERIFGKPIDTSRAPAETEASEDEPDDEEATEEPEAVIPTYATSTALVFSSDELGCTTADYSALPDGYYIPEGGFVFESAVSTLVGVTPTLTLPTELSLRDRTVRVYEIVTPDGDGESYAVCGDATEKVPSVELYMGYIIIDLGDGQSAICGSDGAEIIRIANGEYCPSYTRDSENAALFYKDAEDGERLYYRLSASGAFELSDYVDSRDNRGLYFDYPATYGMTDDKSSPSIAYNEYTGTFTMKNQWGNALSQSSYTSAYSFTEGLSAVTSFANRGGLFFVNESGTRAFPTWQVYENVHGRYVISNYLPPLTHGVESVGFFYFDNGITRVRRQVIDNYNWSAAGVVSVVSEEDILIRADGTEYELPAGYTLEGYSNGVIMLSKDGAYGFMSHGEWIAQPIFADARPFSCGLGVLVTDDGRYGAIDTDGEIVIPFGYEYISQVSDGVIAAYRDGVWEIYRIATEEDNSGVIIETIE